MVRLERVEVEVEVGNGVGNGVGKGAGFFVSEVLFGRNGHIVLCLSPEFGLWNPLYPASIDDINNSCLVGMIGTDSDGSPRELLVRNTYLIPRAVFHKTIIPLKSTSPSLSITVFL